MSTSIEEISKQKGLLKYKEAIQVLSVSKSTFYKYIKEGTLPQGIKVCGVMRWERDALNDYIQSCKEASR